MKHGHEGGGPADRGATYLAEDCYFTGWGQSGPSGGLVFQGPAINVALRRCVVTPGHATRRGALALGMDGDGGEHFGHEWSEDAYPAGRGPANGHVIIEDCFMSGRSGDGQPVIFPVLRVDNARSVSLRRSAVLGRGPDPGANIGQYVTIGGVQGGVEVSGNNTPELIERAHAIGLEGEDPWYNQGGGKLSAAGQ